MYAANRCRRVPERDAANAVWHAVDEYFAEHLAPADAALSEALAASDRAGLPPIQVTPALGKLLQLFAHLVGARRILEIGTLGGYSTIWMARALPPGGRLISLEIDARHAAVARENLDRAGVGDRAEVRVAPALESLALLARERGAPFDLAFIDADKSNNDQYFAATLGMSRAGSVILVDNVVRGGAVIDPESGNADVEGVRRLTELVAREPRVSATAMQTVGSKGYDGFIVARVLA
jgi:predicted O-methyltransferase YrrM